MCKREGETGCKLETLVGKIGRVQLQAGNVHWQTSLYIGLGVNILCEMYPRYACMPVIEKTVCK